MAEMVSGFMEILPSALAIRTVESLSVTSTMLTFPDLSICENSLIIYPLLTTDLCHGFSMHSIILLGRPTIHVFI